MMHSYLKDRLSRADARTADAGVKATARARQIERAEAGPPPRRARRSRPKGKGRR